jgi:2-C-methyl-D-erythritol 2,4-cyclodiphosphate synthase
MRVGLGFDVHRLVPERRLFLGGIEIPYERGLLGHSDGDVVLHAVADAMLAAACLPDIGELFPDTDPVYRGYPSAKIAEEAVKMVRASGYEVVNIDVTVVCEQPKIIPFKQAIKQSIAGILGVDEFSVNVKGKTAERLGEIGAGEAIACLAVASIEEVRDER